MPPGTADVAFRLRRRRFLWPLAGALVALLTPLFLAIPPYWRQDPLIGPLGDRYHVVLFVILPLILHRWGPLAGRPRAVVIASLALGGLSELLQIPFGRSATFWDWYQDGLGVALGACWLWARRSGRRLAPAVTAGLVGLLILWPLRHLPDTVRECRAAAARFPALDDFESPHALILWKGHDGAALSRVAVPGRGHVLQLSSDGDERWPGAASARLPWDWRGQTILRLDCRLVDAPTDSLRVSVWLDDRATGHDRDHAVRSFTVGPGWQTLAIPLADLATRTRQRPLALREVVAVAVYASRRVPGSIVMQIDDLRLGGG